MNESRDKLKGLRAGANGRDDSKNKWKGSEQEQAEGMNVGKAEGMNVGTIERNECSSKFFISIFISIEYKVSYYTLSLHTNKW